jgi:hypothetical protein
VDFLQRCAATMPTLSLSFGAAVWANSKRDPTGSRSSSSSMAGKRKRAEEGNVVLIPKKKKKVVEGSAGPETGVQGPARNPLVPIRVTPQPKKKTRVGEPLAGKPQSAVPAQGRSAKTQAPTRRPLVPTRVLPRPKKKDVPANPPQVAKVLAKRLDQDSTFVENVVVELSTGPDARTGDCQVHLPDHCGVQLLHDDANRPLKPAEVEACRQSFHESYCSAKEKYTPEGVPSRGVVQLIKSIEGIGPAVVNVRVSERCPCLCAYLDLFPAMWSFERRWRGCEFQWLPGKHCRPECVVQVVLPGMGVFDVSAEKEFELGPSLSDEVVYVFSMRP